MMMKTIGERMNIMKKKKKRNERRRKKRRRKREWNLDDKVMI